MSTKKNSKRKKVVQIDPEYHKNLIIVFRSTVFNLTEQNKDSSTVTVIDSAPSSKSSLPNLLNLNESESQTPLPIYKRLKLSYYDSSNNEVNIAPPNSATINVTSVTAKNSEINRKVGTNNKLEPSNKEKKLSSGANAVVPKRKYNRKRPRVIASTNKSDKELNGKVNDHVVIDS